MKLKDRFKITMYGEKILVIHPGPQKFTIQTLQHLFCISVFLFFNVGSLLLFVSILIQNSTL